MGNNTLNYSAAQASLNNLKQLAETVRSNLVGMNTLIRDNVNSNVGVWDGQSAAAFTGRWDELSNDIPKFCTYLENQADNLAEFLKQISIADETDAG